MAGFHQVSFNFEHFRQMTKQLKNEEMQFSSVIGCNDQKQTCWSKSKNIPSAGFEPAAFRVLLTRVHSWSWDHGLRVTFRLQPDAPPLS